MDGAAPPQQLAPGVGLASEAAPAECAEPKHPATRLPAWAYRTPLAVGVAAAVVLGAYFRIWYLLHDSTDADQALIGILARQILAGHFHAFLFGQPYGGVEPYVVAAAFGLFGSSPAVLAVPAVLLNACGCLLVWRIGRRLVRRRELAAVCAAAMWVAPQSLVWNSTLEYGFREVTLVCGLTMVLAAVRIVRDAGRWYDACVLGAAVGLGWWSSPEIVYFLVPTALWLAGWVWRAPRSRRGALAAAPLAVVAAGLGALPWLWDNVTTGFPSLAVSRYDSPGTVAPYLTRLALFPKDVLPTVLDLRVPRSGAWTVPEGLGVALTAAALVALVCCAAAVLAARRGSAPLGVAVVAYPFVLAAVPASAGWQSARYTNFFVPLVFLLAAATVDRLLPSGRHLRAGTGRLRLSPLASYSALVALVAVIALSAVAFVSLAAINDPAGTSIRAGNPDEPAEALATSLERAGVTAGYADYWVAYKLDFLSGGRLTFTDAPPSPDRIPWLAGAIARTPARARAWLFVRPSRTARTEYADTSLIQGPSGVPLHLFCSDLRGFHDPFRIVRLGGADAVVSRRPVTPAQLGM